MILIADSGSTKTDWILADEDKNQSRYSTVGFNPYFMDSRYFYNSLILKLVSQFDTKAIKTIFFYGAGCSTLEKKSIVYNTLHKCFPNSKLVVEHDMLGAAKALLGNHRGFAAIIGTGSNTCIYDGIKIEKNLDSLGYLLGDEGSGCYIGKKILKDFMRGNLPLDLQEKFNQKYKYSHPEIYDAIYNKPFPNRFLAGFCKFADENKEHKYIKEIIRESFNDFFKKLVSMYPGYEQYSFNCVGSVGYIFKDILIEMAKMYKMKIGKVISSPIEDLTNYHLYKSLE